MKKIFTSILSLLISLISGSHIYAKTIGNSTRERESLQEHSPLVLIKNSTQNPYSIFGNGKQHGSHMSHCSHASHASHTSHSSHYSMFINVSTDSISNIDSTDIQHIKHELAKKHNVKSNNVTITNIYIANNNRIYWNGIEEKDIYYPPTNTRSIYIKYSLIDFSVAKKEKSINEFEYIIPFPTDALCIHLSKNKRGGYENHKLEEKLKWMNRLLKKYK